MCTAVNAFLQNQRFQASYALIDFVVTVTTMQWTVETNVIYCCGHNPTLCLNQYMHTVRGIRDFTHNILRVATTNLSVVLRTF